MAKEICISSTPHETRLAILEDDQLAEIYYERENEYTLAGSVYKGRVTRVLPGMQSAFVDIGLERDAFLYVTDFLEEQEESAEFERIPAAGEAREEGRQRQTAAPRPERSPERQEKDRQEKQERPAGEAEAGEEDGSPEGTRRWRGRRGRRRGFRGRGEREGQAPAQTLTTPEVVEEAISAEPTVLPERGAPGGVATHHQPILLPGESLSRYGSSPQAATADVQETALAASAVPSRAGATPMPKPSTLVEAPIGEWDGGAFLPGESISRYRGQPEQNAPIQPAETPVIESEAAPASGEVAEVEELQTADKPGLIAEGRDKPVAAEAAPVAEEHTAEAEEETEEDAPEKVQEQIHEYEPEQASASFRVDPAAPSEFRIQSAVEQETHRTDGETEHGTEPVGEKGMGIQSDSEATHPVFEEEFQAAELPETNGFEHAVEEESAEDTSVSELHAFSPGAGLLEEEVIDEEEFDFEPFHGQLEEQDHEDLEEETLENAGTIGDIIREQHIERRLEYGERAAAEAEEEHLAEPQPGFAGVEEYEEDEFEEESGEEVHEETAAQGERTGAEPERPGRRDDRREGRRGDRRRGGNGRRRQGGGRHASAQTMDLPIISELLKQGQEILVQIAKEPIAKKGARITSHIALPGRYLVFMPTVNHVGVSRKISSDEERQRLKRILISEKGNNAGGFIVRTAAGTASEEDLRADIRFLINLWNDIKQRADDGKAPALIYHDLNLVERVLRDQVSDNFSTIWVDSETEYERIVRFLNRFQPSMVRRVKLYTKETPLFEQFGIQDEISKALKSKVWLKSGGSIVINQTEALVAIDINTGKYVGKTARLEDTILKTNLDAIPEIVRQIRLRDLGGIIVIDFIDMDERKNRHKVMQALEDALKADRAPSKVLQFNDFGLVAITRKRVKQSLERTLSAPCPVCTGTGMVKSPVTVANEIYVEMRKMARHLERNDVLLRVNPEVVKTLKANNARWLNDLEEITGKTVIVKSDPALHPEQFDIH